MPAVKTKKSALWKAVKNHCLECVVFVKKEVTLCTSKNCNLYPYRFGSKSTPYKGGVISK